MSGGVRNVRISNVRLLGQRGVHMKTTRGRGGYIENITLTNVTAHAGIQVSREFAAGAKLIPLIPSFSRSQQLWSTYGSTEPTGAWPYVGNITIIDTGPETSCSLGCGKLPAAYCDSKTFYYEVSRNKPTQQIVFLKT